MQSLLDPSASPRGLVTGQAAGEGLMARLMLHPFDLHIRDGQYIDVIVESVDSTVGIAQIHNIFNQLV